jgi:hypothetical protein
MSYRFFRCQYITALGLGLIVLGVGPVYLQLWRFWVNSFESRKVGPVWNGGKENKGIVGMEDE